MNAHYYGVIMAGGIGSRFWPVSTEAYPKQFHDLLGSGDTLIQKTFKRLNRMIPKENIFVLTNERYEDLVLDQLPDITKEQLLLEPVMRNTAPCILLSALKIQKQDPDAVMLVAPSDHWIEDEQAFASNIKTAFSAAENKDALMTLGIKPSFPNTGYGYIQYDKQEKGVIKKVLRFTEKPDYKTAKSFVDSGNYLWNAGIFIWSIKSITSAFASCLPKMYTLFQQGIPQLNTPSEEKFIRQAFPESENISVDYGVLEKAENVYTLPADFDWNDLGTWGSLYEKLPKDENSNAIVRAEVLALESKGNIIQTASGKRVVLSNLSDYIIVDTENTLIIVPKEKEQEIKQIQELAKKKFS